jgi:hypothetical protein
MSLVELIEHGAMALGIYVGGPELAKKAFPDPIPTVEPAIEQVQRVMDRYHAIQDTLDTQLTSPSERVVLYQNAHPPREPSPTAQQLQSKARAIEPVSLRPGTPRPQATLRPGSAPR